MGRGVCARKLRSSAVRLAEGKLSEVRSIKMGGESDIDQERTRAGLSPA